MNKYMELQHGAEIAFGTTLMSTDARENKSIPDWIQAELVPKARDDRKPLLDIYAEVVRVQDMIVELQLGMQSVLAYINRPPWYQRAYRRIKVWLSTT